MDKDKKNHKPKGMDWSCLFTIILVVLTATFISIAFIQKNTNKKIKGDYKIKIEFIENKLKECNVKSDELSKIILTKEKKPNDILKDSIDGYIKHNYPTIPNILSSEIAEQISKLSRAENVSPELIVGITQVESSFNPMAISSKNARGLMQVMPFWAKKFELLEVCELHNIQTGIRIGIKVLKIHIEERKGDISKGLYYYVNKDHSYVNKVYKAMGEFVMFSNKNKKYKGDEDINDINNTTVNSDSEPTTDNKE